MNFNDSKLMMKSKSMMRLERLQQGKEMIIQQVVCYLINTLEIIIN